MKVLNDPAKSPQQSDDVQFAYQKSATEIYPCPTCKKQIAVDAYDCPGCGQPLRTRPANRVQDVRLTGFNIPFGNWMGLIFTLAIAAIPTVIFIYLVNAFILLILRAPIR